MRALLVALIVSVPAFASAQDMPDLDGMRENARAWGWVQHGTPGDERWCPRDAPCDPVSAPQIVSIRELRASVEVVLARRRAFADGWDVEVSHQSDQGQFAFVFRRGGESIVISWEMRYERGPILIASHAEQATPDFDAWMRHELAGYLQSPESFERAAVVRIDRLEQQATRAAPSLSVCPTPDDPRRFEERRSELGVGMFDTCVHRSLTDEEERAFLDDMHREMARRRRLVRRHHRAWHRATVQLLGLAR